MLLSCEGVKWRVLARKTVQHSKQGVAGESLQAHVVLHTVPNVLVNRTLHPSLAERNGGLGYIVGRWAPCDPGAVVDAAAILCKLTTP